MSLDDVLAHVVAEIPACLAAGCVDTVTGMLLGISTRDPLAREVVELLAAVTSDLFHNPHVLAIDKALSHFGEDSRADEEMPLREHIILSQNLIHVFVRGERYPDHVLVTVAPAAANLGLVIHKTHMAIAVVEAAL